jgi:membrane dipeptidase
MKTLVKVGLLALGAAICACCRMSISIAAEDAPKQDGRKPIVVTDRARELHAHSLLIDGHNDMPWEIRKQAGSSFEKMDISKSQPTLQTDIPKLRAGGVGAQFWSVWVPVELGYKGTALSTTLEQIDLVKQMIARYPETFELALTADDIERIHAKGRIASLIGVEGGHCIEESLAALDKLYDLGARYMTLTHTDSLSWADSSTDKAKAHGLTPFGKQVVEHMNKLGMMVDLAHVSAQTMHAALDVTDAPVIFSHSSAFGVCAHPRNVPDDVLKRLKDKDAVVMVNFFSGYVVPSAAKVTEDVMNYEREVQKKYPDDRDRVKREVRLYEKTHKIERGSIYDVLDHIDYISKLIGPEYVGIGSDFDGVSKLPTQLEDASCYPYITQGLIDRGYTDEQIKGILGGNLLRVMRGVEAAAAKHKTAAAK